MALLAWWSAPELKLITKMSTTKLAIIFCSNATGYAFPVQFWSDNHNPWTKFHQNRYSRWWCKVTRKFVDTTKVHRKYLVSCSRWLRRNVSVSTWNTYIYMQYKWKLRLAKDQIVIHFEGDRWCGRYYFIPRGTWSDPKGISFGVWNWQQKLFPHVSLIGSLLF